MQARKHLLGAPAAVACLALLCATPLRAQWMGGDYNTYGVPQVNYAANSFLNFSVINNSMARGKGGKQGAAPAALRAGPSPSASPDVVLRVAGPAQPQRSASDLAARVPAAYRDRMSGIYVQAFDAWGQLADKLKLPRDDLAGAAAVFIAGNVMAMRNVVVPDEHFLALVAQLKDRLADNPAVAQAGARDKRTAYEQLAMVGMFMATSQMAFQRNPNPQAEPHFRQAGRANLQQVLNVDPERVRIGPQGLE